MDITSIISLFGGLAFFLFGMSIMGDALKKIAGNRMQTILGRLASTRPKGVILGVFVTAIIQSSSATSVMVVSFVSSGIMNLDQAISVIMGANIGTTATGWILTLAGLDSGSVLGSLLSTTAVFAVVAVIGIILFMIGKTTAKKNLGVILVSLSILMSGMKTMSSAMEPLQTNEAFLSVMRVVSNPVLCILVGIAVTALVQSCSASIGILQAMSVTGIITLSVAVPMVIGMSIGACVPVLISAVTANKDGKRSALSYLYFNVLGGIAFMAVYLIINATARGSLFLSSTANSMSIAIFNTLYKVAAVVMVYPFVPQLKKLVILSIKDPTVPENTLLDEMLLAYPSQAIARCREVVNQMAYIAADNIFVATSLIFNFEIKDYKNLLQKENEEDQYDDKLSNFLVKLNSRELSFTETRLTTKFLRCITDIERISDHSENVAQLAFELSEGGKSFSDQAAAELSVCIDALRELMSITLDALVNDDLEAAYHVEPLEEVIDVLTEKLKQGHISRLQRGACNLEMGLAFNDCINNFERVADHCSNIAVSVIEPHNENASESHSYLRTLKQVDSVIFQKHLKEYAEKYVLKLEGVQPVLSQADQHDKCYTTFHIS